MMCGCDAATEWEDGYSYDEKKCVKCPAGFANRAYSYNYGANRCFKCPTGENFRRPSDGPGCFATCAAGQMEEKPEVKIASCSDGLVQRASSALCYECPARTDTIQFREGSYKCIPEATYACIECAQGSLMCMEGACACYETPTTGQLIEARFAKCCNDGSCQDATRTNNLLEQDLIVSDCPNGAGSMMCGCDAATEWEDGRSYDEKKCVKCPAGFTYRTDYYNEGGNRCFKCPAGENFRRPSDRPGCFTTCAAGQMEEKPEVKIASCSDGLFQRIYSTICYECPARTDKIEYREGSYKCIPEATYACIECAQGSLMCMEGACACYETPTTGQSIARIFITECCNDGSCQDATRTNNLLEQDLIVSGCPNGAGSMMCGCNASTGWEDWYEKRCIKCPAGFQYNYQRHGVKSCIKCPAGEELRWPSDGPSCFATCASGLLTETQMFKSASCSDGHVLETAWRQATEYGIRFFCYDCPAGTRYAYRLGDGTTQCEIPSDESHCLQQFGNSQRKECKSTDNSNKMVAELLKYFSGDSTQSAENFGFCLPQLSFPDDIDSIIAETEDLESVGTTLVYTISAFEPYIGVLAGVTDQPSIVFAFPPPASYTWPQDSERCVRLCLKLYTCIIYVYV